MRKEKIKNTETEEHDGTFKFFLIIVLIMAVLSVVCCVGVIIGYNMNKDKEVVEKDSDKEDIKGEVEISDESLKNSLIKYVTYLEKYAELGNDERYPYQTGDIYFKNYKSNDILQDEKLRIVLMGLNSEKSGNSPITTNYQLPDGLIRELATQLEVSDVEDNYKKMFGGSIKHRSYTDDKFKKFFYDDVNNKYYAMIYGGLTTTYYVQSLVSKVTEEKDNVFVYVNVGVSSAEECYADYERTKIVECNPSGSLVTETNKDSFSQYKFIFTKKDGNYSFTEINKIK